uniref:Uncharacterized protein n=1 Tax=Kryptolebias marmoratus TaxID=37003 RepID=A0A3Q3F0J1_KRYMA
HRRYFCCAPPCLPRAATEMCASHLPTKISSKGRAKQFPSQLHESGGELFCTSCNLILEHKRKSTIEKHFVSRKTCEESCNLICEDWVSTCTALNILLSISDYPSMRRFLRDRVVNGGAIPGFHQLQEKRDGYLLYLAGSDCP